MEEIDIREERCTSRWKCRSVASGGVRSTAGLMAMDSKFVGIYAQLLMRYLRAPADALITSLHAAGIELDMQAKPVFIDERPTTGARGLLEQAVARNQAETEKRDLALQVERATEADVPTAARCRCTFRGLRSPCRQRTPPAPVAVA